MKKNPNPSLANPNSIKIRFAIKFLQAMNKLNNHNNKSSSSSSPKSHPSNNYRRYHFIRAAACASMATAVGPRRAWSRALLKKIRNRTLHKFLKNTRRSAGNPSKEDDLRGLVPGGEAMDSCRLLSETAHYIKCLRAQVQVMTKMLDHYSSSEN